MVDENKGKGRRVESSPRQSHGRIHESPSPFAIERILGHGEVKWGL